MSDIIRRIGTEDADWIRLFMRLCDDLGIPPTTKQPLRKMIGYTEREWFIGVAYRIYHSGQSQRASLQSSSPEWWATTLTKQRLRHAIRKAVQEVNR